MTPSKVINHVRRGFYLDSVALMRLSTTLLALPEVESAALMIGTESNKKVMEEAGLLTDAGRGAGANDLIIAIRTQHDEAVDAILNKAEALLDTPVIRAAEEGDWRPKTLDSALETLKEVNLALISVPGEFAAEEARKALRKNLHVMLFSDNVSVEDECALKKEARERGLFLMGPDCGTAIIGGVPLAFANEVPAGNVGIVSASGTGLQEVSSLLARGGMGISQGIGVGGRDLSEAVGGLMTMMVIDALDEDLETERIILISKPPSEKIAARILERATKSPKPFTICFLGISEMKLPPNAKLAPTLLAAAEDALGAAFPPRDIPNGALPKSTDPGRRWIRGLFSGGTLCAEAQVVLQRAGERVYSNAPIPGAERLNGGKPEGHALVDLGSDEYTVGRPHPMIDPSVRTGHILSSLAEPGTAVVLLDVVIGYGSNEDPAGEIAAALRNAADRKVCVVASVCGTEGDPQGYSAQARKLEEAGVLVASSAAQAAELALRISKGLA